MPHHDPSTASVCRNTLQFNGLHHLCVPGSTPMHCFAGPLMGINKWARWGFGMLRSQRVHRREWSLLT